MVGEKSLTVCRAGVIAPNCKINRNTRDKL